MSENVLTIAVLVGSDRPNRFGGVVAEWFLGQARRRPDMEFDVIDLLDVELPAVLPQGPVEVVEGYRKRIDAADGFVLITPEYNHGYPASVKQAIDLARDRAEPYFRLALAYTGMGSYESAVREIKRGLQLDPSWPTTGLPLDEILGNDTQLTKTAILGTVVAWA
ncbi:MAG: NAD(P)H-dependent oxidoreductase, partial [Actinobacteria bacterium]|nr:NAD(P)H-dependent oxidoreductase [Actinomycetota bacterium]